MIPKSILVTGGKGFIGSLLIPFLGAKGHYVRSANLDLLDFKSIRNELESQKIDLIIHLAGMSHVPTCESNPELAFRTNLSGTALLLEGIRKYQPGSRLIFASTAQVYEAPKGHEIENGVIFDEERKISPQNTYALTKWESELILSDAAKRNLIDITILRLFNHTHHSQSPDFFLPHLFHSMKKAKSQGSMTIPVGNLDIGRDIGSISDLLEAFFQITKISLEGLSIFNICSGVSKNLRNLGVELANALHIDVQFEIDPNRIRKDEPKWIVGSYNKLMAATGWKPNCTSEKILIQEFLK